MQLLSPFLSDADWRVRRTAARALQGTALEALRKALRDSHGLVREAAAEALQEAIEAAEAPVKDEVAAVRAAAVRALGRSFRKSGRGGDREEKMCEQL